MEGEADGSMQCLALKDVFKTGSKVYILAHAYYGCEAEVLDHVQDRVRVKVNQLAEPDLRPAIDYKVHSLLCCIIIVYHFVEGRMTKDLISY